MSKIQSKYLLVAVVVALVVVFAVAGSSLIAGDKAPAGHKDQAVQTETKGCPADQAGATQCCPADHGDATTVCCADGCANCDKCADGCDKCKDCAKSECCREAPAKGEGGSCCPHETK